MLTPSLLPSLPPPQALQGQGKIKEASESCPYPANEEEYNMRSSCEECVCWDECTDDNITNATIKASNQLLNVSADKSKLFYSANIVG